MRLAGSGEDRGANLVEFALIMPLLILLVLGIVEFSWLLARNLDVNQGAREGARLLAVNTPGTDNATMLAAICDRLDLVDDSTTTVAWQGLDSSGSPIASPVVGEGVEITVSAPTTPTLTGLVDFFFSGFATMDSTVEIRVEQPPDWSTMTATACP